MVRSLCFALFGQDCLSRASAQPWFLGVVHRSSEEIELVVVFVQFKAIFSHTSVVARQLKHHRTHIGATIREDRKTIKRASNTTPVAFLDVAFQFSRSSI